MPRRRVFRMVPIGLLASLILLSCQKREETDRTTRQDVPVAESGLPIEARLAGRPAWLGPDGSVTPAQFQDDPHTFQCAVCHDTEREKNYKQWRATCETSGCHPRAWPKTVFHRVEVSTFFRCMTCHQPHAFRLEGEDCRSCHDNLAGPAGTVAVTALEGVTSFPHERHTALDCGLCHTTVQKHAELAITSADVCNSCHHGPPPAADCATCHAPREVSGVRLEPVTLTIAGRKENRRIGFDHQRHDQFPCSRCHQDGAVPAAQADCAGCHKDHSERLASDCAVCHRPPPEGVHSLLVHETGCAACHGGSGITTMKDNRSFCLSCHTGMTDHNPGRTCATCHKLAPAGGQ